MQEVPFSKLTIGDLRKVRKAVKKGKVAATIDGDKKSLVLQ